MRSPKTVRNTTLTLALLGSLLAIGCGTGPSVRAIFLTDREGRPSEPWPDQPGEPARLRFYLELQLAQQGLAAGVESAADLQLEAWPHGPGVRYRLVRPNSPPYTLVAYTRLNLFARSDHADCRIIGFSEDKEATIEMGSQRLAAWKETNPNIAGAQRKYNTFFFKYDENPRGSYGFHRLPDGTLPRRAGGEVDKRSLLEHVQSRFEYRQSDDRVDWHPNTYRAVLQALRAWEDSPFPGRRPERVERMEPGASWVVENRGTVRALLRTAVRLFRRLGGEFDDSTRVPFRVRYTLQEWSPEKLVLQGRAESIEGISLGNRFRYQLRGYDRHVVFDRVRRRITTDRLELSGKGAGGEEIRFRVDLEPPP